MQVSPINLRVGRCRECRWRVFPAATRTLCRGLTHITQRTPTLLCLRLFAWLAASLASLEGSSCLRRTYSAMPGLKEALLRFITHGSRNSQNKYRNGLYTEPNALFFLARRARYKCSLATSAYGILLSNFLYSIRRVTFESPNDSRDNVLWEIT